MRRVIQIVCVAAVVGLGSVAMADVFNMGPGLTSLEMVPVGNPGNANDTHGDGYGGVGYEYNIGKYEVTAGQYTEFLNKVAGVDTYGLYKTMMVGDRYGCRIERYDGSGTLGDPYKYRVAADWANRPVNIVSWGDVMRFANWLHNGQRTGGQDATTTEDGAYYLNGATSNAALMAVSRKSDWKWAITTEDEWYKAAYHKNDGDTGNYYDYPTSSNAAPGYITDNGSFSGTGGIFLEGGTDPGNYATYDGDDGANGIGGPHYFSEVGEHENSGSPYGTFDQGGNVWEWNESIHSWNYRGLRGGGFYDTASELTASTGIGYWAVGEDFYIGFRVAQVPEPATLSLLTLGGLAMIRRKRGINK